MIEAANKQEEGKEEEEEGKNNNSVPNTSVCIYWHMQINKH